MQPNTAIKSMRPCEPRIDRESAKRDLANPNGVTQKRAEKCIGVYEFRESVERMAEVSWEAVRAHKRSELDVSTTDMRCPLKWAGLSREEQQATRAEVIKYWGGAELPEAPTIPDRITFHIVAAYKEGTPISFK
jgi:hypothetical protein